MCKKSSLESHYFFQSGAPSVGNNFPLTSEDKQEYHGMKFYTVGWQIIMVAES